VVGAEVTRSRSFAVELPTGDAQLVPRFRHLSHPSPGAAILAVDNQVLALPCAVGLAYVTDAMGAKQASATRAATKRRTQPWRAGKT
jgi:hypothetical protein